MVSFSNRRSGSRIAQPGDKLVTRDFGGVRGFAAIDHEDVAVRLLPGTELSFVRDVVCMPPNSLGWTMERIKYQTAVCRRHDRQASAATDEDALEFPDGRTVLLMRVQEGQAATVSRLPKAASRGGIDAEHDLAWSPRMNLSATTGRSATLKTT
jgi:hypothetical protein